MFQREVFLISELAHLVEVDEVCLLVEAEHWYIA